MDETIVRVLNHSNLFTESLVESVVSFQFMFSFTVIRTSQVCRE